jgi:hypothetical protein
MILYVDALLEKAIDKILQVATLENYERFHVT